MKIWKTKKSVDEKGVRVQLTEAEHLRFQLLQKTECSATEAIEMLSTQRRMVLVDIQRRITDATIERNGAHQEMEKFITSVIKDKNLDISVNDAAVYLAANNAMIVARQTKDEGQKEAAAGAETPQGEASIAAQDQEPKLEGGDVVPLHPSEAGSPA